MKLEMRQLQSPLASSAPPTPTTPVASYGSNKGVPIGLEGTIAPADMLNVLSAHRESVNTADGKKLLKKVITHEDSFVSRHELIVLASYDFFNLF